MPRIGLDSIYMAEITEDSLGNETYGTPVALAKALSANLTINEKEAMLYADDKLDEYYREFNDGTIDLNIKEIPSANLQKLLGAVVDSNGAVVDIGDSSPPPVAIGFRSLRSDKSYEYTWLYRVIFGIPAENNQTKSDAIAFQMPTIQGKIMRRHKADGLGKYPWRAKVNGSDTNVPTLVKTNWFLSVYEPDYSTSPVINLTGQPEDVTIAEGASSATFAVTATATGGTLTYQWYSNTVNSNIGGTPINGADEASLGLITNLMSAGTYYYYCVMKVSVQQLTSNVAALTITGA